ncbi:MAG TPA: hypothetical protein VFD10_08045 [Atribacterota bacterium]|nr:hypothetical protein [Atribacterota bacterium]
MASSSALEIVLEKLNGPSAENLVENNLSSSAALIMSSLVKDIDFLYGALSRIRFLVIDSSIISSKVILYYLYFFSLTIDYELRVILYYINRLK